MAPGETIPAGGDFMRQYAWLDFHGGCWHLVTGNIQDPDRIWASRESALSDLKAEGWIIDGPHEKQPRMQHVEFHSPMRLAPTLWREVAPANLRAIQILM